MQLEKPQNFNILERVLEIIQSAKSKIIRDINHTMVLTYWHIGKEIIEEEQRGEIRAEYGKTLIEDLSKELTVKLGKGYSSRNLWNIRQFYLIYQNVHALRAELSWTHYRLLMKIEDDSKRAFYEVECTKNRWSTRELDRQINSMLFERLALSKDKDGLMSLAKNGQIIEKPEDMVKDPYVLEFLGIQSKNRMLEKDLESALIKHLQEFLLELGRGFSFVARQKRIQVDHENFYIDLVFYNYILKCFVLFDLKIGKLTHQDIGQMQMYVNYYKRELMNEGDHEPIGIVLCADKSEAVVKYTLPEDNKSIFASRYKLYIPTEEELKAEILKEQQMLQIQEELESE